MSGRELKVQRVKEGVDLITQRWRSYSFTEGRGKFNERAKPQSTYRSVVNEQFRPVQRLWRSASSSTLYFKDEQYMNMGRMRRSNSYSSLAPSNAIPYRERSVERYIPSYTSYKPKSEAWRHENSSYQRSASFSNQLRKSYYRQAISTPATQYELRRSRYTPPTYQREPATLSHTWKSITKPTTMTRYQSSVAYTSGKISGLNTVNPFLYRNYELDDDRRSHRLYWGAHSMDGPYRLRNFFGTWYMHRPSRILSVY